MTRWRGFPLLLGASALVHAAAAAAFTAQWAPPPKTVAPAHLHIALGSAGATAGGPATVEPSAAPVKASQPTPTPTESRRTAEARPEPLPAADGPLPAAKPVPDPQTDPAPETEPAEATPETPPERQETEAPDEPVERAQTERRTLASAASVRGNAGLSGTERVSDQPDTEGETDRAGAQTLAADHDARVLARFSAAKRYPAAARLRGQEGTVAVRFTLDRAGRVLAAELAGASGRRTLDKAALDQVHRAAPYPAAPEGSRWHRRTYVSSVAFHLNR